eukprot:PhM_4_TR12896/c0_g1_i1/m.88275/K17362/ACOT13; acyl-coenzyme A thioesterase 13
MLTRSPVFRCASIKLRKATYLFERAKSYPDDFGAQCLKWVCFDPRKDMAVVPASDGLSAMEFHFRVEPEACNMLGFMHGGMYGALADIFTSAHICAELEDEATRHVSVELSTVYCSKAKKGTDVVARTKILRLGRQMAFTSVDFVAGNVICASCTHTKAIIVNDVRKQ